MSAPFDIWLSWTDAITDPALIADYRALLSDDERDRADRFHFERDRHIFTVAHALVRTSLSRYEPVDPRAWAFEINQHGHPRPVGSSLSFNLSHTHGLVACAVTRDRAIGVDVENLERGGETVKIADRFFAPAEVGALRALPETDQRDRFFTYWTLKESYIKARGMGLALPLAHFAFAVDDLEAIAIDFVRELEDDPARWRFGLRRPGPRHVLAYAIERAGDAAVEPRIATVTPLVDDRQ